MSIYHAFEEPEFRPYDRFNSVTTFGQASVTSLPLDEEERHFRNVFGFERRHDTPYGDLGEYRRTGGGYESDGAEPLLELSQLSLDQFDGAETERESEAGEKSDAEEPEAEEPKPAPVTTDVEKGGPQGNGPKKPLFTVFTKREKLIIIAVCAWGGFISPISNAIYLPALNILATDFHVTISQMNLTVTAFMIFQGLTPMFIGNFAESAGYRPAFLICFMIYFISNIALAVQDSYVALLLLRMLQSIGSSGTIALRNGVIASIVTPAERGTALAWVQIGTLMGPAFGPLIGGALAETIGWRWIFWFLAMVTASALVLQLLFVPETNRKIVGNGMLPPWEWWNISLLDMERRKTFADRAAYDARRKLMEGRGMPPRPKLGWPNPTPSLRILVEKDSSLALICGALNFAALYEIMTSIPLLYREIYGFDTLQISLVYIAIGGGAATAAVLNGRLLDYNFRRTAHEHNLPVDKTHGQDLRHFPVEKARMRAVFPLLMIGASSLLAYGWCLNKHISPAAAIVFSYCASTGFSCCFGSMNSMLVDTHPGSPAIVTAAANITRCLLAAAATAAIDPMIEKMGPGWCFTFLSLLMFASAPLLLVIIKKGPVWREERYVKQDKRKEMMEKGKGKGKEKVVEGADKVGRPEVRQKEVEELLAKQQSPVASPKRSPKPRTSTWI